MIYNEKSQIKENPIKKTISGGVFFMFGFLGWVFGANPDASSQSLTILSILTAKITHYSYFKSALKYSRSNLGYQQGDLQ